MNPAIFKPLIVLLLSFMQLLSFSQSLTDSLSISLSHTRNMQPSDQVFLHLDRNLYHPGDTIRFQAYVRDLRIMLDLIVAKLKKMIGPAIKEGCEQLTFIVHV